MSRLKDLWKELFMEQKKFICLRDILDLLGTKNVRLTVIQGTDRITANSTCRFLEHLEDEIVDAICPDGGGLLTVWLKEETEDDET